MEMFNELIEKLRETSKCYYGQICSHVETIEKAADTIELLQKKLEENKIVGWIPCSERLPEERQNVLVFDDYNNMYIAHRILSTFFDNEMNDINVIAWQPLPEEYHG